MASNDTITVVTSRKLPILPYNAAESRLSIGKAWDEWLEEIERQLRYFRVNIPADKKDALLIYGGRELVRLENTLPDTNDSLDEYATLKKKLSDYFSPRRNKYYERYLFKKMRQYDGESVRSYAMRLREKASPCEFHDTCEDRILEHLIHTIPNKTLIRKCITKGWTLSRFLVKACEYEDTDLQIRKMKGTRLDICHKQHHIQRTHRWPMCRYCGLSGIHPKGYNCPAFNKQCYRCKKRDHFTRVCHATRFMNY